MMTQNAPYFHNGADISLLNGEYYDVFSILGMHLIEVENTAKSKAAKPKQLLIVRCLLRGAIKVDVISLKDGSKVASLDHVNKAGLFAGVMGRRVNPFLYKLRVEYPLGVEEVIDPYQFSSLLNDNDLYLFGEGRLEQAYRFLGANWREVNQVLGVHFCLWAPNARRVSVVGILIIGMGLGMSCVSIKPMVFGKYLFQTRQSHSIINSS